MLRDKFNLIECSLVITRTMRESGGRAELQIQVNLLSLTSNTSLCQTCHHLTQETGLRVSKEVDMHHLI